MYMKAVLVLLLSCVMYLLLYIRLGYNLHYKKHIPGQCRVVKGLEFSSKDLQVTSNGTAFITSGVVSEVMSPHFKHFVAMNQITGKIFIFDFNKPELGTRELKIEPTSKLRMKNFHPHGLSILEDRVNGEHLLYVINHHNHGQDRIEKFMFRPTTESLVHLRSFSGELLRVTSDLAVVEEDQFYVSNYLYFKSYVMSIVEHLLPINLGSLIFYNRTDFLTVMSGLPGPNGVTLSNDGKFLFVAYPLVEKMEVYKRRNSNRLQLLQSTLLYTCPDHFHLSSSGDELYVGAHPIPYKALDHLNQPDHLAPSSVLRVPLKNGLVLEDKVTELFYDHGDLIAGSSVAAVYNKQLIIGSVMSKLILCDIDDILSENA